MIDLSNVTLWSSVWTEDVTILSRTVRMFHWCNRIAKFQETILFSCLPDRFEGVRLVKIPTLTLTQFNLFTFTFVPGELTTPLAMQVHEDGFPTHPELWSPEFLQHDYIGAPWPDGVVGNGGFSIESKRLRELKESAIPVPDATSPWAEHGVKVSDSFPSDVYLCRMQRPLLDRYGVRFAPTALAQQFSTEQTGHGQPSFGFHGRTANPERYKDGWRRIEESEG